MSSSVSRSIGIRRLVVATVAAACTLVASRSHARGAPQELLPDPDLASIAAERAQDDLALAAFATQRRELLAAGHGERWVAIAGGEVLPRDEQGAVAPAETLAKLLTQVDARLPAAHHRYVFRLDDPEQVDEEFLAPNLHFADALGNAFFQRTIDEYLAGPQFFTFTKHGRSHRFDRPTLTIDLPLADPAGGHATTLAIVPSTGYAGCMMVTLATARRLGLARFEVPGVGRLACGGASVPATACTRARVRVKLEDIEVDEVVPVLIWPEPPMSEAALLERVHAERRADEAAFAATYVPLRERLIDLGYAGRWIAIAGGRVLPKDDAGAFTPVDSLDALLERLAKESPGVLHRFVFRIGEEGETRASHVSPSLPGMNAIGRGFFDWIGRDYDARFAVGAGWIARDGRRFDFAATDAGVALPCSDPAKGHAHAPMVVYSEPFSGTMVLDEASARQLGAELFEIPGVARVGPESDAVDSIEPCRRARVRVAIPEIGLERLLPIAIWPPRAPK